MALSPLPRDPRPLDAQDWREKALGKFLDDVEIFFPPEGAHPDVRRTVEEQAKRICRQCPVVGACLEYAVRNHEQGVWGATNDAQRVELRAQLEKNLAVAS